MGAPLGTCTKRVPAFFQAAGISLFLSMVFSVSNKETTPAWKKDVQTFSIVGQWLLRSLPKQILRSRLQL